MKDFVKPSLKTNASENTKRTQASFEADAFQLNPSYINNQKADPTKLRVTFPNGLVIKEDKAVQTFIKAFQEFGLESISKLPFANAYISSNADMGLIKKYKPIFNTPYYINSNNSTEAKKQILERIAKALGTKITVEVIEK